MMMAAFGHMLKEWRAIRRFSQLQLAMEADMSARHLSFLESGRANPSKSMVLRLSQALEMPRPVANQALHSAGFAPAFPDTPSDAPELAPVRKALEMMLASHDPFPGVAVDRHWNIVSTNKGGAMLITLAANKAVPNLMELLMATADSGLIENWEEVAILSLTRLRSEINEYGGDETLSAMANRLAAHDRLKASNIADINLDQAVIPTSLRMGEVRLSLFSTIAQFGSVQDVRTGELRIELMFPMDDATEAWFKSCV
jgi:transcriptional regulator with XRE-family HTH domain